MYILLDDILTNSVRFLISRRLIDDIFILFPRQYSLRFQPLLYEESKQNIKNVIVWKYFAWFV